MIDFNTYLREIEKAFQSNLATEHTYRPFLQTFVESFDKDITAINEPKRRTFGAPDYVIRKRDYGFQMWIIYAYRCGNFFFDAFDFSFISYFPFALTRIKQPVFFVFG